MTPTERLRDLAKYARKDEDYFSHRKLLEAADTIDALVEALEKALLWTDEDRDVGPWRETANDALAKAKGGDNE